MKWIYLTGILFFCLAGKSQDTSSIRFQKIIDSVREVVIADTGKYSLPEDYPVPLFVISKVDGKRSAYYSYGLHIPGKQVEEFINEFLNISMGEKLNSLTMLSGTTSAAVFGPEGRWDTYIFTLKKNASCNPFVAGFTALKNTIPKKRKGGYGDNLAIQKNITDPVGCNKIIKWKKQKRK